MEETITISNVLRVLPWLGFVLLLLGFTLKPGRLWLNVVLFLASAILVMELVRLNFRLGTLIDELGLGGEKYASVILSGLGILSALFSALVYLIRSLRANRKYIQ